MFLKNFKKKDSVVYINKTRIKITPVTYDEMLEVIFLILPYLKLVRVIKEEHQSITTDPTLFFDIVQNLILQLNRRDLNRILQILLRKDGGFVNQISHVDFIRALPVLIRENKLIDTVFILRNLGAFE